MDWHSNGIRLIPHRKNARVFPCIFPCISLRILHHGKGVMLLLVLFASGVLADALSERRAQVGLNLFRTFVAADNDIARHVDSHNALLITMLYVGTSGAAEQYQRQLQKSLPSVKQLLTRIHVMSLSELLLHDGAPAAVFVTEKLSQHEREQLVNLSIDHRFLVFSPFEGDVEQGILGGLAVEARVRPVVNMNTLRAGDIPLKDFYLSVSRQYE